MTARGRVAEDSEEELARLQVEHMRVEPKVVPSGHLATSNKVPLAVATHPRRRVLREYNVSVDAEQIVVLG